MQIRQTWLWSRPWLVGIVLVIVSSTLYWWRQYSTHATPEQAMVLYTSGIGSFDSKPPIPFGGGVVLFGEADNIFTAYYAEKSLWGWHIVLQSADSGGMSSAQGFGSLTEDGKTFVWGTNISVRVTRILDHHEGKTYSCTVGKVPVWHMVLPFSQSVFRHSEWTMVLPNGKTVPFFG